MQPQHIGAILRAANPVRPPRDRIPDVQATQETRT